MKAEIWNHRFFIEETNPQKLVESFGLILKKADFGVVGFSEHHFQPYGYTAFWLLSESHFAVHTFPEESKSYCELSSCNKEKYEQFLFLMKDMEIENAEERP